MKSKVIYFLVHLLVLLKTGVSAYSSRVGHDVLRTTTDPNSLRRNSFPTGFVFGAGSSAYQTEGAAYDGGKGPSIWDTFTQQLSDRIKDGSNGSIADDSYHRYREDVGLMKDIGFDAYSFSISWPRILPNGKLSGGVNQQGIAYYNHLIDELISNGLQPFVALFHWDLPQALEDEYGGFLSPQIVQDFQDYAELCYKEFGDRVKHWFTLNEPTSYSNSGYALGTFAPGRCSKWMPLNCTVGDSSMEPYIVTHHQLLAHASAVNVYRQKYQMSQKGHIGISVTSLWFEPFSQTKKDRAAVNRGLAFMYGWIMEPLTSGSYPAEMVNLVKERMPKFSAEQSSMVKGSFDFIGLNYYTAYYVAEVPCSDPLHLSYATDACLTMLNQRHNIPIGPQVGASGWLSSYPEGLLKLLLYTKENFNNPVIYITENGSDEPNNKTMSLEDDLRITYLISHLSVIKVAIEEYGIDLRGYFVWSLLDNFEWNNGYTVKFGIYYVDFEDGLKRYAKRSAKWFKKFLRKGHQIREMI